MANEFIIKNGLLSKGHSEFKDGILVTGSAIFQEIITGSIQSAESASIAETASLAESSSYSLTSSYSLEAVSASYSVSSSKAESSVSASYALTASYALNAGGGSVGSTDNSYVRGVYFASQDTIAGSLLGFSKDVAIESGSSKFLRFADRGLNSSEILPAAGMVKNDIAQGTTSEVDLVTNGVLDVVLPADFSGSAGDDLWLQGFNGTRFAYFTAVQPTGSYIQKVGKILNTSGSLARIYVDIVQEWDDEQIAFNAVSSSYALSSSFSESGSYSVTSSHAVTASYALSASIAESSSYSESGSYAVSSSYSISSSYSVSSSFSESGSYAVSASHLIDFVPTPPVKISGSAPQDVESGSLWYNTEDGNTYVQFNSPTGSGWVPAMASILSVESASYATTSSFAETKKVTWCYARRIAFGNQTLTNTTNIEFDNVVADGISYSLGAFTLPPNGVYEIEGNVIASDKTRTTFNFWDITNAAWIGSSSGFYSPSDTAILAGGSGPAKSFVVTGASSVQVALRTTSGGSQVIGTGDFATGAVAYVAIKKLN